ncbi:MAG: hypothetical protein Q7J37_00405, partial [Candidatus Omnitrophota bacterium]|nr:hypothetical protein [Candidatus Omnitrophota bacterium]
DKKRIIISVLFLSVFFSVSTSFSLDNQPSKPAEFTLTNAILTGFVIGIFVITLSSLRFRKGLG